MGKSQRLELKLLLETKSTSIERIDLYKVIMNYLLKKWENDKKK